MYLLWAGTWILIGWDWEGRASVRWLPAGSCTTEYAACWLEFWFFLNDSVNYVPRNGLKEAPGLFFQSIAPSCSHSLEFCCSLNYGVWSLFLRIHDSNPFPCLNELLPVDDPQIENDVSPVKFLSLNSVFFIWSVTHWWIAGIIYGVLLSAK